MEKQSYELRRSDFNPWKFKGLRDYVDRTYPDYSFKVRWRGSLIAGCAISPILIAIGLGFLTTFYFEGRFEFDNSKISATNLEETARQNPVAKSFFFTKDL